MSDRREAIERAVFASLGCTTIDYSNPRTLQTAAVEISRFIEAGLDEWEKDTKKAPGEAGGNVVAKKGGAPARGTAPGRQ